jgi:hypothetical protein
MSDQVHQSLVKALKILRLPENHLMVWDNSFHCHDRIINLLAIKDIDDERSLGDYQNVGYFLLSPNAAGENEAVVIDPGLRDAGWIRELLGIKSCDVLLSHFHLDHWIGYEGYLGQNFYASSFCKTVLTKMVGAERSGKSIFVEGRLNDYHHRPLPLRAVNDAERLLPFRGKIIEVAEGHPYQNPQLALEFFELPFGQTEGTIYGLLQAEQVKVLFASDLFVSVNGDLRVEPHYAFKPRHDVIQDVCVMLRAVLGKDLQVEADGSTMKRLQSIAAPDLLALGHELLVFTAWRDKIEHLLGELEEMTRIIREHII